MKKDLETTTASMRGDDYAGDRRLSSADIIPLHRPSPALAHALACIKQAFGGDENPVTLRSRNLKSDCRKYIEVFQARDDEHMQERVFQLHCWFRDVALTLEGAVDLTVALVMLDKINAIQRTKQRYVSHQRGTPHKATWPLRTRETEARLLLRYMRRYAEPPVPTFAEIKFWLLMPFVSRQRQMMHAAE